MEEENILSDWSDDVSISEYIVVDDSKANGEYLSDSDQSFIFINGQNENEIGATVRNLKCRKKCDTNCAQPVLNTKIKTFAEIVLTPSKVIPDLGTSALACPIKKSENLKVFASLLSHNVSHSCMNVEEIERMPFEPEETIYSSPNHPIFESMDIDNLFNDLEEMSPLLSLASSQNSHYSIFQNIEDVQVDCLSVKPNPVLIETCNQTEDKSEYVNTENLQILPNQLIEEFEKDVEMNSSKDAPPIILLPSFLDNLFLETNDSNSKLDIERHLVSAIILFWFLVFGLISSSYLVFNDGQHHMLLDDSTFYKASPYYSSSLNDPHQAWAMTSQRFYNMPNKSLPVNKIKTCYWKKMRDMLKLNIHNTQVLVDHSSARLKGSLDENLSKINKNHPTQVYHHVNNVQRGSDQFALQTSNLDPPDCIRGQPVWLKERLSKRLNCEVKKENLPFSLYYSTRYQPISNIVASRNVDYTLLRILNFSQSTNYSVNEGIKPTPALDISKLRIVRNYTANSLTFNLSQAPKILKVRQPHKDDRYMKQLTLRSTLYHRRLLELLGGPYLNPGTKMMETNRSSIFERKTPNVSPPRKYTIEKQNYSVRKEIKSNSGVVLLLGDDGLNYLKEKSTALALFGALDFPGTLNAVSQVTCPRIKGFDSKRINSSYNSTCSNLDFFRIATQERALILKVSLSPRPPAKLFKMVSAMTCHNSVVLNKDVSANLSSERSLAPYAPTYYAKGILAINRGRSCSNFTSYRRDVFAKYRVCVEPRTIKNETISRALNDTVKRGRCIAIPVLPVRLPIPRKFTPVGSVNRTKSNFKSKICSSLKNRNGYVLAREMRRLIKRLERYEKIRLKGDFLINRRVRNIALPLNYSPRKKNWFLRIGWGRRVVRSYVAQEEVAIKNPTPCKFVGASLKRHGLRLPCSGSLHPCPLKLQIKCPVDSKPEKRVKRCKAEVTPRQKDAKKFGKRRIALERPPGVLRN